MRACVKIKKRPLYFDRWWSMWSSLCQDEMLLQLYTGPHKSARRSCWTSKTGYALSKESCHFISRGAHTEEIKRMNLTLFAFYFVCLCALMINRVHNALSILSRTQLPALFSFNRRCFTKSYIWWVYFPKIIWPLLLLKFICDQMKRGRWPFFHCVW